MKRKNVLLVIVAATVIAAIAFSGYIKEKPEESNVIKIGAILPLTGDLAVYGNNIKNGIDLAVEEINGKGGINGAHITLIYKDNGGKQDKTVSAMNELVGEVPVVIGAVASSNTLAVCPIAEDKKAVLISPSSTSPKLSDYKNYVFRAIPSDEYQGVALTTVVQNLGYNRVAVLFIDNNYGTGLKDAFIKSYQDRIGGNILAVESFKEGDTDFKPMLARVKEADPEAIVLIGYVKEGSLILKQAKEMGMNVQWICSEALKSDEFIALSGDCSEGVLATFPVSTVAGPATEAFKEAYRAKYYSEPGIYADYGYDTMIVIAEAIKKGGYNADGIRDALREIRYAGVSGAKIFDENGDVPPAYDLWQVENGKWVLKSKFVI